MSLGREFSTDSNIHLVFPHSGTESSALESISTLLCVGNLIKINAIPSIISKSELNYQRVNCTESMD